MNDCIFCKIIKKKIPAKLIHEDAKTIAFNDINPQAPTHVLIVPKKHIEKISDLMETDGQVIAKVLMTARSLAEKNKWHDYRLVFNNGLEAGQTVFHIHLHLLSGRRMTWPPG